MPVTVTSSGNSREKLAHVQILRAAAASLVVISHELGALNRRQFTNQEYAGLGFLCGDIGVSAFFVLSGFIMVHQAAGHFGGTRSPIIFLWRRITRIVPMYWIATWLWFWSLMVWGVRPNHPWLQMALSLSFLPNVFGDHSQMNPILGQGWTLNFEMGFYLLFAAALFFPERRGLSFLVSGLVGFFLLGELLSFLNSPFSFYLRILSGLLLFFAVGVLIGWAEWRGKLRKLRFPVSPAWLLPAAGVMLFAIPSSTNWPSKGFWYGCLSLFAVGVVFLCVVAGSQRLSAAGRIAALLGDASYCTYLFHLWANGRVIDWVHQGLSRMHLEHWVLPLYLICGIIGANVLGLAIHLAVERPLTKALGRVRIGGVTYAASAG